MVTISGRLASGALALEHHTGLSVDESSQGFILTVRGLEGTARYDMEDTLELARPGEEFKKVEVPQEDRTEWTVEEDFIGAIRAARAGKAPAERPVRPDFEEGLLYMRKVEAVHQSATSGAAVQPQQL